MENEKPNKYLSVKILGGLTVNCFKNRDKTKDTQPDFKGDGIAIWINTARPKPKQEPLVEENLI